MILASLYKKIIFLLFLSPLLYGKILTQTLEQKEKELEAQKTSNQKFSHKGNNSLYFRGDDFVSFFKKNISRLEGNVFVKDGDFSLRSDNAIIYSDENKKTQKIEAFGNVFILRKKSKNLERIEGYSKKAFYYPPSKKLTLLDDAKIIRNKETLEGDIMHYNLETEELSGKRVNGYFVSNKK